MPVESGVDGKIFSKLNIKVVKIRVFIISLTYIHIENQTQYEASFIINRKKNKYKEYLLKYKEYLLNLR